MTRILVQLPGLVADAPSSNPSPYSAGEPQPLQPLSPAPQVRRTDWVGRAVCAQQHDPEALFADGPTQRRQTVACRPCPVRTECLAWALDTRAAFGVLGGMTERQRRALLRRRPDVASWADLLAAARGQWETEHPEEVAR